MLLDIAGWIAPAATMIAAMMTAANLGARVTGWGFVVFLVGSMGWTAIAILTHQPNLLWTNALLAIVNAVGVWRWLGRRAQYEDGGAAAAEASANGPTPDLFPLGDLESRPVEDGDGAVIGHVIGAMATCAEGRIAYVVLREGGLAGVGERLHMLGWDEIEVSGDRIATPLSASALRRRKTIAPDHWPAVSRSGRSRRN